MSKARYADSGRRMRVFYITRWKDGEKAFAEALGISHKHLELYFCGKRDPMTLARQLAKIGCDVNYIETGKHFIGLDLLMLLDKLQQKGVIDYRAICRFYIYTREKNPQTLRDRVDWLNHIYTASLN